MNTDKSHENVITLMSVINVAESSGSDLYCSAWLYIGRDDSDLHFSEDLNAIQLTGPMKTEDSDSLLANLEKVFTLLGYIVVREDTADD